MTHLIRFFKRLGSWSYVITFTILAIVLSEILVVIQSHLLTGSFFDKDLLIVGFITPAVDAFIVLSISAFVIEHLNETKDELEAIFHTSKDGIAILSLKSDFLDFNDAYLEMTGYEREELLRRSCIQMSAPEDVEKAKAVVQEVIAEGFVKNFEKSCIVKDGTTIIINMSLALMPDKKRILITTKNITEEVRIREELRRSQEQYKGLMDFSSDGIFIMNAQGDLLECSHQAAKMLGYSVDEMKTLSVFDWDVSHTEEEALGRVQNTSREIFSFETRHRRKDRSVYDAFVTAVKIRIADKEYIYASARDITERNRKEKEDRERLQKFIDTQNSIVILSDGRTLKYVNRAFLDFLGYKTLEDYRMEHDCICEQFMRLEEFFHVGKVKEDEAHWIESLLNLSGRRRVVSMIDSHGEAHAFSVSINHYEHDDHIVSLSDISDTMIEKLELSQEAIVDELTRAYNRAYFNRHIERLLSSHQMNDMKTGLVFFDVDHFKEINDTFGHDVGDQVLYSLVSLVKGHSRNTDKIIRWGGEEFIIICELEYDEALYQIAEHLRSVIEAHRFYDIPSVTCSFGCVVHDESISIFQTIKKADERLYLAKENGRNRVEC